MAEPDLAAVAALIGEPTRSAFLAELLDGRALAASELAARARVSRPLASAHLSKLLDGGLVRVEQRGRQRLYRLADVRVARVLETIATIAPPKRRHSLRDATRSEAIRFARSCYDHLAGTLGVAVTGSFVERGLLEPVEGSFAITDGGSAWMQELGLDLDQLRRRKRAFSRQCLDWSERRPHLAGALGAALLAHYFDQGWLRRSQGSRALTLTAEGERAFSERLGVNSAQLPRLISHAG